MQRLIIICRAKFMTSCCKPFTIESAEAQLRLLSRV